MSPASSTMDFPNIVIYKPVRKHRIDLVNPVYVIGKVRTRRIYVLCRSVAACLQQSPQVMGIPVFDMHTIWGNLIWVSRHSSSGILSLFPALHAFIMMLIDQLAEAKIKHAIDQGELRGLPGEGRRLDLVDDSLVPAELRLAYRLLKNAGYVPAELVLRREISDLHGLLRTLDDGWERCRVLKRLDALRIQLGLSRRREANMNIEQSYFNKLCNHLERR